MRILDNLKRGHEPKENKEERIPGKTYRDEPLKRKKSIRKTSVSSTTFFATRAIISTIVIIGVALAILAAGFFLFDIILNW